MRNFFLPLTAVAATLFALGTAFNAVDAQGGKEKDKDKEHHHHHHMTIDACAIECSKCERECESCSSHCAKMVAMGKKEHLKTLQTCRDCATLCGAAASIVSRNGPFADLICKACAEACARCGKECDKFNDDAHMKQCAEACKKCEQACKEMLTRGSTPPKKAEAPTP